MGMLKTVQSTRRRRCRSPFTSDVALHSGYDHWRSWVTGHFVDRGEVGSGKHGASCVEFLDEGHKRVRKPGCRDRGSACAEHVSCGFRSKSCLRVHRAAQRTASHQIDGLTRPRGFDHRFGHTQILQAVAGRDHRQRVAANDRAKMCQLPRQRIHP